MGFITFTSCLFLILLPTIPRQFLNRFKCRVFSLSRDGDLCPTRSKIPVESDENFRDDENGVFSRANGVPVRTGSLT